MKIAFCLYGQPRKYKKGFEIFKEWFQVNNIEIEKEVDFFFHTWTLNPGEKYNTSNYRVIPESEIIYNVSNSTLEEDLLNLYHPVNYLFEHQKPPDFFKVENYEKTIAYVNTKNEQTITCIPNVLSQLYSLYQVYNLCKNHVENTGVEYDCVVVSRFDFVNSLRRIRLNLWDCTKKVILPENHYPRKLIFSSFIIMPFDIFLVWMPIYKDLDKILNDSLINNMMKKIDEKLIINTEEIYTAYYLHHFHNHDNLVYINPPIRFTVL